MIDFEFFRVKVELLIVDDCGGVLSTLSGQIDSLLKNDGVLLAFSNIDGCLCRGVMGCFLMSLLELSVLIIFALDSLRLLGMKILNLSEYRGVCGISLFFFAINLP